MLRRTALLLALILACLLPAVAAAGERTPRVLVLSAFSREKVLLEERMAGKRAFFLGSVDAVAGELAGCDAVLALAGKSMVNAAANAQRLLDAFNVTAVVFSGIAGGVNPALKVGDVVIPERWAQHYEHLLAKETQPGRYHLGNHRTPVYKDDAGEPARFGMAYHRYQTLVSGGSKTYKYWFEVDPEMLQTARLAAEGLELLDTTRDGRRLSHKPKVYVGGSGVSGSAFVENAGYRRWLWRTFQASAVDMESAAVAQVALMNDVPFLAMRSLSDLAGADRSFDSRIFFRGMAADNAAAVVMAFLREWSRRSP